MNPKKAEALYRNSIKILKKVQTREGGCLATPLGHRYPYIYPRDNAVCILGFVSAGRFKEAGRALDFILGTQHDVETRVALEQAPLAKIHEIRVLIGEAGITSTFIMHRYVLGKVRQGRGA